MSSERHARAKQIFLAARELGRSEREAHVREGCGDDAELERAVRGMLAHDVSQTLLAPVASEPSAPVRAEHGDTIVVTPWRKVAGALLLRYRGVLLTARVLLAVLFGVGLWKRGHVRERIERTVASLLQTVLDADVQALSYWAEREQQLVESWAGHSDALPVMLALVDEVQGDARDAPGFVPRLHASEARRELVELLEPLQGVHGHRGFALVDPNGWILASSFPDAPQAVDITGQQVAPQGLGLLRRTGQGDVVLEMAFPGGPLVERASGGSSQPLMLALAPVRRGSGAVVATLVFVLHPERDFSGILNTAELGESGETYAFDSAGVMVSRSRFMHELVAAGLVAEDKGPLDTPYLELLEPPGDIRKGDVLLDGRERWAPTKMARLAVKHDDGVDVQGYVDYRGVVVVGAWRWLEEYGIGVATEVDKQEAYRGLDDVRAAFNLVLGLLGAALALVLLSAFVLRMQQRRMTRFGQYILGDLLGEGGMGAVYRARHELLQRPTAIKLIRPGKLTHENLRRFKREVQLTSRLTHPNTVEVFDFGHTDDDVFYYAMEYLPGITLGQLVKQHGPLPPARAIHVLRQVCASLGEAHERGLVHRDVKPANIMLCERGNDWDVVKVLDFGLVKEIGVTDELTQPGMVGGTPLYIAPETLQDAKCVDGRSDLYAVGCVAFYLLTGKPVFMGSVWRELMLRILDEPAPAPGTQADQVIPVGLDQLVTDLLAKRPEQRPASARDVVERLDVLAREHPWEQADARAWWQAHAPEIFAADV